MLADERRTMSGREFDRPSDNTDNKRCFLDNSDGLSSLHSHQYTLTSLFIGHLHSEIIGRI